jgi:hypothetical protein
VAVGVFGFAEIFVQGTHGFRLLPPVSAGRNCRSLASLGMTILRMMTILRKYPLTDY